MNWWHYFAGFASGFTVMLMWAIYEQRTTHREWCRLVERLTDLYERKLGEKEASDGK